MKHSVGIIPYRFNNEGVIEFFVGHPGGNKENIWYYLKGQMEEDEDLISTAIREFKEETGLVINIPEHELIPLGTVRQSKVKNVTAFGYHYPKLEPDKCHSNLVENSTVPEIDKYRWITYDDLREITHPTHRAFYENLIDLVGHLGYDSGESID